MVQEHEQMAKICGEDRAGLFVDGDFDGVYFDHDGTDGSALRDVC